MSASNNFPWRTPSASPACEQQPPAKRAKLEHDVNSIGPEDEVQIPAMVFSEEQQAAIDLIVSGANTFLTGSAGSGKTVVLKEAIRRLRNQDKRVDVTAPTGRAAEHVGGSTLSHFARWSPFSRKQSLNDIKDNARQDINSKHFKDLDTPIIDEISMVSSYTLERLNYALRAGRADKDEGHNAEHDSVIDDDDDEGPPPRVETLHKEPFGGVQLVCCGDFCQLPPVSPFEHCIECGKSMKRKKVKKVWYYDCEPCGITEKESKRWAFSAASWKAAKFDNVFLGKNQRQSEISFVSTLDRIARGEKIPPVSKALILHHPENTDGAIKLFAKNEQVDEENKKDFETHEGETMSYQCHNYFWRNRDHRWLYDREIPAGQTISPKMKQERHSYSEELELKLEMPVILLRNIDVKRGLVNGSQGRVVGFEGVEREEVHKWSAHIYQGESCAHVPSRGGEFASLYSDQIKEYVTTNSDPDDPDTAIKWPRVLFENEARRVEVVILPDCRLELYGNEEPYSKECRTQIPLTARWAMTIHKSQGMTLDKVIVHLDNVFQAEQVYVGLSRAKSTRGLKVIGETKDFDKHKSDPAVLRFLKKTKWAIGEYVK
ncbi:ATP-dependent DNA helicase pfh1 [Fulvia fulva]|nr:ATP-dependent DNA helicase pfh1 [Fulvia fulva]WPV11815.1 ATP-dependent DNA helicase pfh1 [Fulvia fulva]WPV26927.1 ATP-dependent DNA helicase pfh1 [Fulvia fulva]